MSCGRWSSSWCSSALSFRALFLLLLLLEKLVEGVESTFPLLPERRKPEVDVLQRTTDDELSRAALRLASLLNEARLLENAEVLRDGGLGQSEGLRELGDG